jgi:hypothetical protein
MNRAYRTMVSTLTLATALGGTSGAAAAMRATQPTNGAGAYSNQTQTSHSTYDTETDTSDEVCTCTATYSDGSNAVVDECSRTECPDLDLYLACRDAAQTHVMPIGGCKLLETCECTCTTPEPRIGERYGDDVALSGVTNLWQFDYGCGAFGDNAVGCGPVAAAMLAYWWAQQGYDGLVAGFLARGDNLPATAEHDWQAMVETFRDDYLDGGICIDGQYATTQTKMESGLAEYFEDSGYSVDVDRYKVCASCTRSQPDEIDPTRGLGIIVDELDSGRPVIIGFNVGRATEETRTLVEDSSYSEVFSGDLSNGGAGWIDHYAVITGYANIDGEDVLYLNLGWDHADDGSVWVDIPFVWEPAGPWLHLYTLDIDSSPDGADWCSLDRGVDATFLAGAEVDASFDDPAVWPETAVAGGRCGIVREVTYYEYYPQWSGVSFECDPQGELEQEIESTLDDALLPGGSSDTRGDADLDSSNGVPIVDWIPPPGI